MNKKSKDGKLFHTCCSCSLTFVFVYCRVFMLFGAKDGAVWKANEWLWRHKVWPGTGQIGNPWPCSRTQLPILAAGLVAMTAWCRRHKVGRNREGPPKWNTETLLGHARMELRKTKLIWSWNCWGMWRPTRRSPPSVPQKQKEDQMKTGHTAQKGRGPTDKGHGKPTLQDAHCFLCLTFYCKDLLSVLCVYWQSLKTYQEKRTKLGTEINCCCGS